VRDLERALGVVAVVAVCVPALALGHALTAGTLPALPALLLAAGAAVAVAVLARPAGGPPTAATAGVAMLAGHAVLALGGGLLGGVAGQGCLPALGRGAELGLRLAILAPHSGCPAGTFAPGAAAQQIWAPVVAAVAILAGHAAVAAAAAFLHAYAGAASVARRLVVRLVHAPQEPGGDVITSGSGPVHRSGAVRLPHSVLCGFPPVRRGPPALRAAV
jgi:hypothetical protein